MSDSKELISFIASMSGEGNLRVEENLGEGFVRLRVSEAERRQAKHDIQHVEDIVVEMLRNARDAGATTIYVATQKEEGIRTLLFLDNASGVPQHMHEKIFDARVTSKLETMKMDKWGVHGRGMALFSIRQNANQAYIVTSDEGLGSSFKVVVDTNSLSERADQSTWPEHSKDPETGEYSCTKGPHNIIRTIAEFALLEMRGCEVYFGTPTEIATTMYEHAMQSLDQTQLLFVDNADTLPVVKRLALAGDAVDFIEIANGIGINVSERTAHRILNHTLKPLRSVRERLLKQRSANDNSREIDLAKDRRGLKIDKSDLERFSRQIEKCFGELAETYYLSMSSQPKIRVTKDKITISFPINKDE